MTDFGYAEEDAIDERMAAERALLEANRAVRMSPMLQKRGRSKQDFGTPKEFLQAVELKFGRIGFDLAASSVNAVVGRTDVEIDSLAYHKLHFNEADNSLTQDWLYGLPILTKVAWLNPPFADLAPWATKCESVRFAPRWTLMLCPASMGSQWWAKHVLGKCMAFGVPRMQFVGSDSTYPKDLALLAYGYGVHGSGFWDWRRELELAAQR